MIFEHFAINVKEPVLLADWYSRHVGLHSVFELENKPYTTFLADDTGRTVIEVYSNDQGGYHEFGQMHHLTFHVAFESDDAEADKVRLLDAGATFVEEVRPEEGTLLVMLRDPWGIPLQICQRRRKWRDLR